MKLRDNVNEKHLTICEYHRQIYRELQREKPDNKKIIDLLEWAFYFGKKLHHSMKKINPDYNKTLFKKNPEFDSSRRQHGRKGK